MQPAVMMTPTESAIGPRQRITGLGLVVVRSPGIRVMRDIIGPPLVAERAAYEIEFVS
jgi:hypothetical protein